MLDPSWDANFVFGAIWFYSQNAIDPFEGLANVWVQAKNESRFFKISFNIFGYLLEPCIKIWQPFLNFGQNMAIENLTKLMSLAL
jgi:hypothetical protein